MDYISLLHVKREVSPHTSGRPSHSHSHSGPLNGGSVSDCPPVSPSEMDDLKMKSHAFALKTFEAVVDMYEVPRCFFFLLEGCMQFFFQGIDFCCQPCFWITCRTNNLRPFTKLQAILLLIKSATPPES